ncbi:MAG: YraN family protein, partial [candidate division WWE3 bacterium]|nr:YraN family protein [candidate division WWE3 bacterium]
MEIGPRGEKIARRFLEDRGFRFIKRNFKTPRWGEIDLIMRDGDTIVVVEVKTRSESSAEVFGGPLGAINA